jgi:hypothetical protein
VDIQFNAARPHNPYLGWFLRPWRRCHIHIPRKHPEQHCDAPNCTSPACALQILCHLRNYTEPVFQVLLSNQLLLRVRLLPGSYESCVPLAIAEVHCTHHFHGAVLRLGVVVLPHVQGFRNLL